MRGIYNDITETIGKTPLVRLNKITKKKDCVILAKVESFNPLSSVKDRLGYAMIRAAEKEGKIKKNTLIVEPTSGNTGIALAFVCAARGYRLTLTMPESMSIERRKLLKFLGAELVLTKAEKGMAGAIEKAQEIVDKMPDALMLQQFKNKANPLIHYNTTGPEIWQDVGGKVDIFIAGVGTGGTLSGAGKFLKEKNPDIKIIAVEPASSAVLSDGPPGPHKIQGIGAGFIPDVLNKEIIDKVVKIKNDEAFFYSKKLAKKEGILAGISAGAAVCAALKESRIANNKGKVIAVILPDTGERYLSTELFDD